MALVFREPFLLWEIQILTISYFLELVWAIVTLFLIGKLGITISFAVLYTYTAEMLPTIMRSGGVGAMSTCARFGAMMAPFVPLLVNDLNFYGWKEFSI